MLNQKEIKNHIITFIIMLVIWAVGVLGGLTTNYYQTLSFNAQLLLCIFTFFIILPLSYFILLKIWQRDFIKSSLWCAFHASIPIFIYDYIYVGMIKELGLSFVFSHWYLAIFYFIVWMEIPIVGFVMQKKEKLNKKFINN